MADESHQNRPFFPVRGRLPSCPALWRDASHRVRWRDAFHGVPWPGWNRALHGIVAIGRGWNRALEWTMSSGEQPIRSFVEGRSGPVGLRARCYSSTAPASGRTPNAARPRRCPGSRGSAWSAAACRRCVGRAGAGSGLPAGWDHHGLKQGGSVLELEEACCARRNGGPARVVYLREHQQRRDDRRAQRRNERLGSGAVEAACAQYQSRFKRTGQFWNPAGTKPSCVWALSGAMSAGIDLRGHPPRQPVQKLKCAQSHVRHVF